MKSKKFDVLVIGELNVDIIINHLDSFPEIGKEKFAKNMAVTLGSSSAIFACNLSSLGVKVGFLGKIGNDYFGKIILDRLMEKGVDISFIIVDNVLNTGASIVLNFDEDRAMVTFPGAMSSLTISDIPDNTLALARHLHFSSYYLQEGMKSGVGKMFESAKKLDMTTSFDMQWDPKEKWDLDYTNVLPYVDIFLPNENEIIHLTQENSINDALKKLSRISNEIAVKKGSNGSLLQYKGTIISKEPFLNNNVVDAIGAGDSFNAGFIFKYINGFSPEECLEFGNLMGAINTTAAGGTTAFANYEDIMKIAKERFGYNK